MPSKRPAPFKAQYDAGRLTLNTCDHATGGERPCTVALTVSGICLYHGTSWDRQADLVAAEHDAVRKGAVYRARAEAESVDSKVAVRKQHRSRWLLAFGLLLGLVGWFGWTGAESQEDAGCRDVRVSGRSAKQDAIAVGIPLTAELGNESSRVWPATEQGIKDAYARKRRLAGQSAALMLAHPMCFTEAEVSEAQGIEKRPTAVVWVEMPSPRCADGWLSPSIGAKGACSHHGDIARKSAFAVLHFDPPGAADR